MHTRRRLLVASAVALLASGGSALTAGAAAANVVKPAVPHAATTTDTNAALAAVADNLGDQYVFWKGQDGNLWFTVESATTHQWSAASAVPGMGPLGSEPTVAIYADSGGTSYVWALWQGKDGNLWMATGTIPNISAAPATFSSWSGPTVVAGMGPLGSKPAAQYVVHMGAANGLWVFWKGADNNLWSAHASTFSLATGAPTWPAAPSAIPGMGPLGSEPTVGADGLGDIFVFWQGAGNNTRVWESWYNATAATWSLVPIDLGSWTGNTGSPPSVGVAASGQQYVFWQGQDTTLYQAEWNGPAGGTGAWSGWTAVPGTAPMNSEPAVTTFGGPFGPLLHAQLSGRGQEIAGAIDVYWKGTDDNIWTASYSFLGSTWTGPTSIGGGPLDGI